MAIRSLWLFLAGYIPTTVETVREHRSYDIGLVWPPKWRPHSTLHGWSGGGGGSLNNFRSTICTCVGCFYQEQRQRFPFQAVFGAFYQEEQRLWCPFQCQYHHILQVVGTREVCRELLQPVQVYEVPRLYSLLLVKSLIPWTHGYYLNLQTLLPLCVTGTLLV